MTRHTSNIVPRSAHFVDLHRDEAGAAYSLSFVLVLPLYVSLIVFVVELALMLNTKMAVTHAAYAAARAAAVWYPAGELAMATRLGMTQLAAVNALAPIASHAHEAPGRNYFRYPAEAPAAWAAAYRQAGGGHDSQYLQDKWRYAAGATRMLIEISGKDADRLLTVTLEYQHPFQTSGGARMFGRVASWMGVSFGTQTIRSSATLPLEIPRSDNQSLGIPLHVDYGFTASAA